MAMQSLRQKFPTGVVEEQAELQKRERRIGFEFGRWPEAQLQVKL